MTHLHPISLLHILVPAGHSCCIMPACMHVLQLLLFFFHHLSVRVIHELPGSSTTKNREEALKLGFKLKTESSRKL
jgi:hypothetical protein